MPVNLAYRSYQLIWEALDWIYPPNCGGCNQSGTRWCEECAQLTQPVPLPFCPICGNPNNDENPCLRCHESRPDFDSLRSLTVYHGPVRNAIHRLKYRRDLAMGEALSRPMIKSIQKLNWSLDIITCVPLGLVRFEERGYNQATLLARPIALCLKIPFLPRALHRTRETRSQVGLSVSERRENMVNAFRADEKFVTGKTILVVDDVATSGATLNACARALLTGGALRVYCFTLARAVYSLSTDLDLS
jgi:competence protein ComFC